LTAPSSENSYFSIAIHLFSLAACFQHCISFHKQRCPESPQSHPLPSPLHRPRPRYGIVSQNLHPNIVGRSFIPPSPQPLLSVREEYGIMSNNSRVTRTKTQTANGNGKRARRRRRRNRILSMMRRNKSSRSPMVPFLGERRKFNCRRSPSKSGCRRPERITSNH
jgi:hypothetical protein